MENPETYSKLNPQPGKCKTRVTSSGEWHDHRCCRNVWNEKPQDGHCRQHHPETESARYAATQKRWKEKQERDPLLRALKQIEELKAENANLKELLRVSESPLCARACGAEDGENLEKKNGN